MTQFSYKGNDYTILADTVSNSGLGECIGYIRQLAAVDESGKILLQENLKTATFQTLADLADLVDKAPNDAYIIPFLNVYAAPNADDYSTMTFQESEIYGEDVLEDTECNVEESVMQRMDIERVRTALKMLAPEERAIIQDFFFTESPIPVKELVEKYAMPKTSIYRKRDDALKKLKKILGNA